MIMKLLLASSKLLCRTRGRDGAWASPLLLVDKVTTQVPLQNELLCLWHLYPFLPCPFSSGGERFAKWSKDLQTIASFPSITPSLPVSPWNTSPFWSHIREADSADNWPSGGNGGETWEDLEPTRNWNLLNHFSNSSIHQQIHQRQSEGSGGDRERCRAERGSTYSYSLHLWHTISVWMLSIYLSTLLCSLCHSLKGSNHWVVVGGDFYMHFHTYSS